ncbi:MAG TPA: hypothetical protein HA254_00035 [Candidatus Diapherotrites archaeon]|uniref:Uncharacterized protein n=1 Tax=Candidatus Iainarchaeum sp. TaxID=3101447 RepID=A0A7J4IXQ3_9ARCH|nr:hypothetical protein [Candidatus Diapherotrites archaeon]
MANEFLAKNFFWLSYFRSSNGKKRWISRTSHLLGSVSLISGAIFLLFVYLTVGAAVQLSGSLHLGMVNYIYLLFMLIYALMLSGGAFFFFKDILSSVVVNYDGSYFRLDSPITVRNYVNVFFLKEHTSVGSAIARVEYSKALFDIFSEHPEYYYTLEFVFTNAEHVKYPFLYTSSDLLAYFFDKMPMVASLRFGHFTQEDVKKIAAFFEVPCVLVE